MKKLTEKERKWMQFNLGLLQLRQKVKNPTEANIKEYFDNDPTIFYAIIETYCGKVVDVFCTDHKDVADFVFKKLDKEKDEKYSVMYKECRYNMWKYKLFDITEEMKQ